MVEAHIISSHQINRRVVVDERSQLRASQAGMYSHRLVYVFFQHNSVSSHVLMPRFDTPISICLCTKVLSFFTSN